LGQTLAKALAQAGVAVTEVSSRSVASARALALGVQGVQSVERPPRVQAQPQAVADACDTVFITVNDDQIQTVAQALSWRAAQRVVHCSGATGLDALASAAVAGSAVAGFHPLHTFGDVESALAGLPGCAVAVECSDPEVVALLSDLARRIGARPFALPPGGRALYHASAHYAGSLVVTLMDEALRHWSQLGVPPQQALDALLPLLRSTVRAMESQGLGAGMAGVVARGDAGTLAQHLHALGAVGAQEQQLYADISLRSVRLALASGRISADQARALHALLKSASSADGL
jgi:predicted short-subunit dehydrogenase-like oxidoreductase (DUF2520 family)